MKTIMKINLVLRRKLFAEERPLALLKALTEQFITECAEWKTRPCIVWMPQKDDVLHIQKTGDCYYQKYADWAKERLLFIDMTPILISEKDLDACYCDDTDYGGHFTAEANKKVANFISEKLAGR